MIETPTTEESELSDLDHGASDILIYNAPIDWNGFYRLLELCESPRASNVVFFLTTGGGDADAAYRIARCLLEHYKRVVCHVSSFCKSAGTLVALGAHELVVHAAGELGPLDVQLRKRDELDESWSGNDLQQGLTHAMQHALVAFRETFLDICVGSGLTARLSSEAATGLVAGLYSKIFEQIDPARLGEIQRANQVGLAYGQRLAESTSSATPDAITNLVLGYPSHGFVIDFEEARGIFKTARRPTEDERQLAKALVELIRRPRNSERAVIQRIPDDEPDAEHTNDKASEYRSEFSETNRDGGGKPDSPSPSSVEE